MWSQLHPDVRRTTELVQSSLLFDSDWYCSKYPDVIASGLSPELHYVRFGAAERRWPNPLFDPEWYRQLANLSADEEPLVHYLASGWKKGLSPHPLFDPAYYRQAHPDVDGEPLAHFLHTGEGKGYDPHPLFWSRYYVERAGAEAASRAVRHYLSSPGAVSPYPLFDPEFYAASSGENLLVHYLTRGAAEGRNPHPLFHTRYYENRYRAMLQGENPLAHYARVGGVLPHQPHPLFVPEHYAGARPEAAHTGYPMLIHYVEHGGASSPHPLFDAVYYLEQAGPTANPAPLAHYIRSGNSAELAPNRSFDTRFYIAQHAGIPAGTTALGHYLEHCFDENADPHPAFSTAAYLGRQPVLLPGESPLGHFLRNGPFRQGGRALSTAAAGVVDAPPGVEVLQGCSSADQLRAALDRARAADSHLLVVPAGVGGLSRRDVERMLELLRLDPLFGCAIPRAANGDLADGLDGVELPRRILNETPEFYIVPEMPAAGWLIRREVVLNAPDLSCRTLEGACTELLYRMRRIGYRCVVANQVTVETGGQLPERAVLADLHRLACEYPDHLRARRELGPDSWFVRLETMLSHDPKSLLLDGRGIPAGYNGTSELILGLLSGIVGVAAGWRVTLLVNPGVDEFHSLSSRYPAMRVITGRLGATERFRLAVRLSQPWYPDTVEELHQAALFHTHFVYDTIAWDALYPAPQELGPTWSHIARYSDALIYISEFTRRRFEMRFRTSARPYVCYPSLDPADYVAATARDGGWLLVAGNEYDHKAVGSCVAALAQSMPGAEVRLTGRIEGCAIGAAPQERIDDLYAGAGAVIFPSFYEGFGFPMIRAMAYGKRVYVRRSELAEELLRVYRGPGSAVLFESLPELVELLRAPAPVERVGQGAEVISWQSTAAGLMSFLETLASDGRQSRWLDWQPPA